MESDGKTHTHGSDGNRIADPPEGQPKNDHCGR